MDELRARITAQSEIRECCVLTFTETWLTEDIPDSAIQLESFAAYRGDRTLASGKHRGGGVCVYVNKRWCTDVQTMEKHCSQDIELLMVKCRPFYLPREFSAVYLTAVYIPPQANTANALGLLHDIIDKHETKHPDTVFIISGDFNHCNLRTVLPKYYQHVSFPTRENNILDQVYSNMKGALKAVPRPHFGKADHISIFLYPTYRQLLKQAPPVSTAVKVCNEETDQVLQDCFGCTNWDVFKTAAGREDCTVDLDEYASAVTGYISTCIETVTTTKYYRKYPNQKQWMNCDVRAKLRARSTAFVMGTADDYKKARYDLRRSIREAKSQYRQKLEGYYSTSDPRRMWAGLQHITDYRQQSSVPTSSQTTLPDELNEFYARFDSQTPDEQRGWLDLGSTQDSPLMVTSADVRRVLNKTNPRKAAGTDNISGRALRVCSSELADVLADIFNLSLAQASVPTCFKSTTIVPVPKKSNVTCLNDYRPIALTPIVMKCFERLVMTHIKKSILAATVDPLQFAYRQNRSTDDAVNTAIHTALSHLQGQDTYVTMLFIDYSSAFNTVSPHKLTNKLLTLVLSPSLCNWVFNFLTGRPQSVRVHNRTSSSRIVSTGTPQGCVLSPLLYTLFTYDCVASQNNTSIIKFADETTVIGLITGGVETSYRREVADLIAWCRDNNLLLNTDKTKEMIIDPRTREKEPHRPLFIGETEVERVKTFKFLGTHISEDLTWSHNTQQILKKSQRRLYFLRRLRKFGMSTIILSCSYRCTMESVLTASITVWYGNCTTRDRKALQRVIKTSQNIVGAALPSLQDIYKTRVLRRTHNLIKDSTHPQHSLFTLLPSGRRYRSLKSRTTRLANSFYPQAIRLLNEALTHATQAHTHSTLFIYLYYLFVLMSLLFCCLIYWYICLCVYVSYVLILSCVFFLFLGE
ncbi:uncharacterized protein LOC129181035 [Dunckerocampus dactyliophorus]|uniref:uncharacterized protein LOC129181035 n=1 Tax=Dunckerocampus dactyliophorus TaxID=161453 RepID=UPI0024051F4F|nr:uncharacterized protein LOC129181035 [Dunckerocampus dactyliophorus]